ncbi:MAG: murein hydrolase activator EnvC family protein [Flavobacterium sp.]
MTKYWLFFVLTCIACISNPIIAQNSEQQRLEEQKQRLLAEIEQSKKILSEIKNQEKSIVAVIMQQKQKIDLRERLIQTNERQAQVLANEIKRNEKQIETLNKELEILKEDYARMIKKSYTSQSEQSKMMYLLSSENLLQAYKRNEYMKQYANHRKQQAEEIHEKNESLKLEIEKLSRKKQQQENLIAEQEKEKEVLEKEKKEQEALANKVKKDQKKVLTDISKKQSETKKIDQRINQLIRQAIAEANRKSAAVKKGNTSSGSTKKAESTTSTTAPNKIDLTPEGQIVSNNFKVNKGKLPWPTEKGYVSMKFGNNPHPLEPSIIVNSNGIEITTDNGSKARAIFPGEVMMVQELSPVNRAVFIQHGDFITVYQNLTTVNVTKGQKIAVNDIIGSIRFNESTQKTSMKFSVLQNDVYLNPVQWLMPR